MTGGPVLKLLAEFSLRSVSARYSLVCRNPCEAINEKERHVGGKRVGLQTSESSGVAGSVLVTGSDRGIGLGLVKRFLTLPCPPKWVFATTLDLNGEETKEVKELACKHPNLVVLQVDVTVLESIQAALKEVGKCVGEAGLTLLINNAGIGLFNDLDTENAKDMMTVYSINTIGPLQMSQAFLPLLKKAAQRSPREGLSCSKAAIINTSSSAGSFEVMRLWDKWKVIGYRCSKAALNMLTKCQSLEYPSNGILSVCIHPGWVRTNYKDADLSVEESTQGIMTVLSMLSEEDNGTFVDWLGRQVPW
ncbi:C-signal-like [Liasis olivaceus]